MTVADQRPAPGLDVIAMASPPRAVADDALWLARRVRLWPFAGVEMRGARTTIYAGTGDLPVARLNLRTGGLTVFVDADVARPFIRSEPAAHATRDGVRLDVRDADSRAAGERLLRWRIDLVRFGPQWAAASP